MTYDTIEANGQRFVVVPESVYRDAVRYPILRRSVLAAPLSAGFVLLTTEADIDAQCDQLAIDHAMGISETLPTPPSPDA
jgi:hypothetical protein